MRGLAFVTSLFIASGAWAAEGATERLDKSARVLSEIMSAPDKGIPQDLLNKAQCVVIIPEMKKGAFIVGGEWGSGFAECRNSNGTGWGAPAALRMRGGSVGFQIGGEEADVVMLVMNRHGMNRLLQDKFTLGADASVAAGPVGRSTAANTDAAMRAEILAWSRSRGIFAGIALNGAVLQPDRPENAKLYGHELTTREVVMDNTRPPAAAQPLIAELNRYSSMSSADRAR